jgi:ergothioneine biosynthesis protein EgtB
MLERPDLGPSTAPAALAQRFEQVRAESLRRTAMLSDEDCTAQSMPDASPVKWHLAHTTWFFETFILEEFEPEFRPFHESFRVLFNSYYNQVGEKHPRPQRGLLTRPSRAEVMAYRCDVDAQMLALLGAVLPADRRAALIELVELGLQHEQQHQELIVTDVMHLLHQNPLFPAYGLNMPVNPGGDLRWCAYEPGVVDIGYQGEAFCFDNELPRHRQFIEPFQLATRLVTNAEYTAFIEAGGYQDPSYWLAEGWDFIGRNGLRQPAFWHRGRDGSWQEFSTAGLVNLQADAPLLRVCYYEAAAYAQWAGARLPTEAEWEYAASRDERLEQLFGVAWQWTSSSYAAYPGFVTAAGAVGEYNGKFMVNQYVLRGSSIVTPEGHSRVTYRNFFPAYARWQFTGIRLAQ